MLLHDVWFYIFLAFLVEHGIASTLLYLAVRKLRGVNRHIAPVHLEEAKPVSTLRQKLQQSRGETSWTSSSTPLND